MNNNKNKKVMSIAIEPELHESVKEYAKRKGVSASAYIGDLVHKALKINIDEEPIVVGKPVDENIMAVVLKIPSELKGQKESLTEWLVSQCTALVKKLAP
jgi:hypothetical protein